MGYSVSSPGPGPAAGAGGQLLRVRAAPRATRRRANGRDPLPGGRRARGQRTLLARAARRPRVPRGAPAKPRPSASTDRWVRELEPLLRRRRYAGLLARPRRRSSWWPPRQRCNARSRASCHAGRLISDWPFVVQLDQFILGFLQSCIMFGSFFSKVTIGLIPTGRSGIVYLTTDSPPRPPSASRA